VRKLAVLAALVLAGCGPGAGSSSDAPTDVNVVVSRDFGAKELRDVDVSKVKSGDTVMRLLERRLAVETRYGGGFVQSLEGLAGGRDAEGRPVDWFYYVNGIEAGGGAAARKVAAGDRIWWDRHPWDGAQRVPAVVGSWPEPFLSGQGGKKIPMAIVCAGEERSCDEVQTRLSDEGVEGISQIGIGAGVGQKLLRIVVGPWSEISGEPAAHLLGEGPGASGVYVRPGDDGFDLLDAEGEVVQTRDDSVGLVAATRFGEQQPTWIVTGTDDAGVAAAAAALRSDVLSNRFAVAIIGGKGEALPLRTEP
jgi:hypothetical protein